MDKILKNKTKKKLLFLIVVGVYGAGKFTNDKYHLLVTYRVKSSFKDNSNFVLVVQIVYKILYK